MSARVAPPFSIRVARAGEIPSRDPDVAAALVTDPDGALVAVDSGGNLAGFAVTAVREDTLLLLDLEVKAEQRAKGAGRALFAAARSHGTALGAGCVEALTSIDPEALAFFLRRGLSIRTLLIDHVRAATPSSSAPAPGDSVHPVGLGAPLTGWIADLDRASRGFARPRDWARWIAEGEVVSLKRGGRPQALGALETRAPSVPGTPSSASDPLSVGPILARSPEAAADLLALLVGRAGERALSLVVPAENRGLLLTAAALGFLPSGTRALVASRRRGDFRRYAGGRGRFF